MIQQSRQREDSSQSSYLSIIMYSDEHGETTVEGDEEKEQLPNGVYEEYYEDAVFEIDNLPTEHHSPSSSPDMQVRYYVPTNEAPHGLSRSVDVNESFMRSMILSTENNNSQEFDPTTTPTPDNQVSNSHLPIFNNTIIDDMIYSQSAPVTSFLYNYFQKYSTESPKPIHQNDHQSMKEEVIHLVTVSKTSSLHDIPSREGSTVTITKSPVQEKEPMFTKNDSVTSQPEQSDAPPSSFPISSHNETENNLQMVTNSQSTVVVDDSVDAWNSFSAAHLDTRNRLSLWKSGIERLHDTRDNDIHSVGFVSNVMVYAVPMIVSDISSKTKYRDVQSHFIDSNVLSVRYVNKIHCAYITYVNYEEMLKAVFKYNGSVLKGKTIYCRPSFFEEMEKDNELCSKLLLRRSQHSTKKQTAKRISFIPELNGISQYESKNTVKRYTVSLSQYHPQYLSSYDRHQNFRSRYPYYASKTVPIIRLLSTRTYFPSHYVIIKPWLKLDVLASKKYQYWSVSLKKACQLNYLFKNSNEVNLIFSVKGTKSYQGYAVMKSEVLDLKLLTSRDTVGTMFQDTGFQFKTQANGRPWRYAFRVDWKNTKKTGLSSTKDLANPWLNNYCVNLSKDCTVVEPTVGKKIVQIINGQ